MAMGYEVLTGKDKRVVVVLHRTCRIAKEDILALLAETGIDPSDVTFVEPENIADSGELDGTPVIIPIDDGTCELAELEGVGRYCGTSGGRVIVLFGPDCHYDGLHPIADKDGTQCDWSAAHLKGCIAGDEDSPQGPAGTPVDWSAASEVKCRSKR